MENLFPIYNLFYKPFILRSQFSIEKGLIAGKQQANSNVHLHY